MNLLALAAGHLWRSAKLHFLKRNNISIDRPPGQLHLQELETGPRHFPMLLDAAADGASAGGAEPRADNTTR